MTRPRDSAPPIEWARYYVSLGFGLCHMEPGTKGPKAAKWNTAEAWINTPERVDAQWSATPTHGMGLIHAASGTVAIDVDDLERTRHIFAEFGLDIDALLAEGLRIRGSLHGRAKAIFRAPDGDPLPMHKAAWIHPTDRTQSITLFELRSGPVHDVLPPSQHPDGHRYEWLVGPWEFASIPTLPPSLAAFWREWEVVAEQIKAMSPWAVPVTPIRPTLRVTDHNDVIGAFNRARSVDSLLQAAGYVRRGRRYLAPSSTSKLPGVSILPDGRVYSHHGSDPLADGFPHDAFDVFRILECGGDVGEATRRAGEALGIDRAIPSSHDFTELLRSEGRGRRRGVATESHANAPHTDATFPAHLLEVPGLVGDIADYINATARLPQPVLALGAAVAAVATLVGRKVRTDTDLRSNIYVLAIGEAGSGKEHARRSIRKIFDEIGRFDMVAVENLASDAAVYTAVHAVPSSLFLIDEMGKFLAVLTDQRAGSHLSQVVDTWLKLYGASNGPCSGKAYADPEKATVTHQPNLSIYGTATPGSLYGALSSTQVEDGFLSRVLVFETSDHDPEPRQPELKPVPRAIVTACEAWRDLKVPSESGGDMDQRPDPFIIPPDAEARATLDAFERAMRARRMGLRAQNKSAGVWVRASAAALKLALIRAAGRVGAGQITSAQINGADARWACELAEHLTGHMARRVGDNVADNSTERALKRIEAIIREAGAEGLSKSDLTRRTAALKRSERDDALKTLGEMGAIYQCTAASTGGRPSTRYVSADFPPEEEGEAA